MKKETEELLREGAAHLWYHATGCVITLFAMLSGIAVLSAVVVVLFV